MSLTMPKMVVEAAFAFGPYVLPSDMTWTNITPWVRAADIKRGRQHELQRFEAGTATLTINNTDGRFSPWNTSGPYSPNLIPSVPVRITATWAGTAYPVFFGYVDSWVPAYGKMSSIQTVTVTDAMKLLTSANLDRSAYTERIISDDPYSYFVLGENGGEFAFDSVGPYVATALGNAGLGTGAGPLLGGSPGACGFDAFGYLQTNIPFSVSDLTQTFECWAQSGNPTLAMSMFGSEKFQIAFTSNGHVQAQYNTTTVTTPFAVVNDQDWHHIVVTLSGGGTGTMTLYVDGIASATGSYASFFPLFENGLIGADSFFGAPENGWVGNIGQVALYGYALTQAQVTAHFQLGSAGWETPQFSGQRIEAVLALYGWPTGMQTIAAGFSQVQAATSSLAQNAALSYIQQLEATEQGQFYVDEAGNINYNDRHYIITAPAVTASNGYFAADDDSGHFHYVVGSIVPGSDDVDLWTDVLASRQGGNLQQATANQNLYGWRSLTGFTGLLQEADEEVVDLAHWLLTHYDVPIPRIRQMAIDNTADAGANFPQMLGRKLMDRITVDWIPLDGTTDHFVQESLIESIEHNITQDKWTTTWGLSPAETQGYLILDDTTLGLLDTGRLAF